MRRIVFVMTGALVMGAAGCGGSKKAELPSDAKKEIGKPVVLNPEAKTQAEKNKGRGVGMD